MLKCFNSNNPSSKFEPTEFGPDTLNWLHRWFISFLNCFINNLVISVYFSFSGLTLKCISFDFVNNSDHIEGRDWAILISLLLTFIPYMLSVRYLSSISLYVISTCKDIPQIELMAWSTFSRLFPSLGKMRHFFNPSNFPCKLFSSSLAVFSRSFPTLFIHCCVSDSSVSTRGSNDTCIHWKLICLSLHFICLSSNE